MNYYENIGKKIAGNDKKLFNIIFVLTQNTLFGDEGIGIAELSEILKGEVSQSKIRKSINDLKDNGILEITKEGKKELFDINTKRFTELE